MYLIPSFAPLRVNQEDFSKNAIRKIDLKLRSVLEIAGLLITTYIYAEFLYSSIYNV